MRHLVAAAAACTCAPLWAAGGHHAVDDAAILATGDCEIETWASRARRDTGLVHAGAQCGVAGVELGLWAEPAHEEGATRTTYAVQAKWAREWFPGWHAGLSLNAAAQAPGRPRYSGSTVSALLTWSPRDEWALNVNAGRDLRRGEPDTARHGAGLDWMPRANWTFTVERFLEDRTHFARVGARWTASQTWTFDISAAQRVHGPGDITWTVGATRAFASR